MIALKKVKNLHDELIEKFGGSKGVRDEGSLLAALARPFATFDQQDLYPTPVEKAAAVFESVIINHPFFDGNKRIAYLLLRLILLQFDFDVVASEDEKYDFTIAASTGTIRKEEITLWIKQSIISV